MFVAVAEKADSAERTQEPTLLVYVQAVIVSRQAQLLLSGVVLV